MSEIIRELQQEIRDKKRTASGIHSKKGIRGYVGKMLFPTDLMSRKEKYNHRKAGKCIVTNMYDEIISRDKFKMLPHEEQVKTMSHWKNKYSTKQIAQGMGISEGAYYNIVSTLGLSKKYKTAKPKAKPTKAVQAKPEALRTTVAPEVTVIERPIEVNGLLLAYKGKFTAEEICKKLDKISLLLSDEESKFDIEIKVREIK